MASSVVLTKKFVTRLRSTISPTMLSPRKLGAMLDLDDQLIGQATITGNQTEMQGEATDILISAWIKKNDNDVAAAKELAAIFKEWNCGEQARIIEQEIKAVEEKVARANLEQQVPQLPSVPNSAIGGGTETSAAAAAHPAPLLANPGGGVPGSPEPMDEN